ncbi:MAG: endonuclease/exonuclease/phosphatase family protein [Alphaproteobacteria bacterium]
METIGLGLVWALDLGLNFSAHVAALLLVVALVQVFRGRVVGALAAGLPAAGLLAWVIVSHAQTLALPEAAGGGGTPLRVLSFNILVFNEDHAEKMTFIRERKADVVLLQETNPRWWGQFQDLRGLYPHMRRAGPIGVLVFSKYPLGDIQGTILQPWPETLPRPSYLKHDEGIIRALVVPVTLPGGPGGPAGPRTATVISFHATRSLSPQGFAARARDLERLAGFVAAAPGPVIVGGDFNATPMAPAFRQFLAQTGLKGLASRPWHPLGTWPNALPAAAGFQIDHLLAKGPLAVRDHGVIADASSNHRAVWADFVIEP